MAGIGPEREIRSVVFDGPYVEISYTEPRDRTQRVMTMRTTAIDPALVHEDLGEVLETLNDMLDTALVEQRLQGT